MRARGQLESEILQALRSDEARTASARDVANRIADPVPAITTVLTVLDRLRTKGLVERDGDRSRGFTYRAVTTHEQQMVQTMLSSLGQLPDRHSALLRFVGELDAEDEATLRAALNRNDRHE